MRSVPGVRRRAAAAFTFVLTAVAVVLMALGIGAEVGRLLAASVLLVLATIAAWYTVTRAGWRRAVGSAVFVATLAVLAIITLLGERTNATITVAGIALFVAAQALGRWALGRDLRTLKIGAARGDASRRGHSSCPVDQPAVGRREGGAIRARSRMPGRGSSRSSCRRTTIWRCSRATRSSEARTSSGWRAGTAHRQSSRRSRRRAMSRWSSSRRGHGTISRLTSASMPAT